MIKKNELRIGNFVKTDNEEVLTVMALLENDCCILQKQNMERITVMNPLINPIAMIEYWLKRLGLTKSEDSDYQYCKGYMFTVSHTNKFKEPGWFYEEDTGKALKYVHKLQNLYFELREEELVVSKATQ